MFGSVNGTAAAGVGELRVPVPRHPPNACHAVSSRRSLDEDGSLVRRRVRSRIPSGSNRPGIVNGHISPIPRPPSLACRAVAILQRAGTQRRSKVQFIQPAIDRNQMSKYLDATPFPLPDEVTRSRRTEYPSEPLEHRLRQATPLVFPKSGWVHWKTRANR